MSGFVTSGPTKLAPPNKQVCFLAVSLVLAISVAMTAGRAYNSEMISLPFRLGMWIVISGLIVTQAIGFKRLVLPWFDHLPASLVSMSATWLLVSAQVELLKRTPIIPKQPDPYLDFIWFMAPPVLSLAALILLLDFVLASRTSSSRVDVEPDLQTRPAEVECEMPPLVPSGALVVQAQQHYIEVHTEHGKQLVRARMRDAEQQLEFLDGRRIHRSWWVARSHILRVVRRGRDYQLHTRCGLRLPVARSKVSQLRAEGWLD